MGEDIIVPSGRVGAFAMDVSVVEAKCLVKQIRDETDGVKRNPNMPAISQLATTMRGNMMLRNIFTYTTMKQLKHA